MKLLHVTPCYVPAWEQGGPVQSIAALCAATARLGHDVAVLTTNVNGRGTSKVPLAQNVWVDGVRVRYYPISLPWPRRYNISLPLAAVLHEAVAQADVVHIHGALNFPSAAAAMACRRRGVPYVVSPRGVLDAEAMRQRRVWKSLYFQLVERPNLRGAKTIHFTSEQESASTVLDDIAGRRVVVPNAVDPAMSDARVLAGRFRNRYTQLRDRRVLLFLGRLSYIKGLDFLIEAFGQLARRRGDVQLVLAGPDIEGYGRRLRSRIEGAGLSDRILFTGLLVGDDKRAALADADLLVLASYAESFGVAVAEALMCAVPVVLSTGVRLSADVAAAGCGLALPHDPTLWAGAIDALLDDGDARAEMGRRGVAFVAARFDSMTVARQMCAMYETVASREAAA